MAGFSLSKMKRKDLEEVNDDFSEFSLSSPARKIRRLDVELPPIMEEEEPAIPFNSVQQVAAPMEVPVISMPVNEERALVLYKPVNAQMLQSTSSNLSFRVHTDLIPGLKNQIFWTDAMVDLKKEEASTEEEKATTASCLAVVPWVPSPHQHQVMTAPGIGDSGMGTGLSEPMETEAGDVSLMEVEEANPSVVNGVRDEPVGMGEGEGLQQWQHCMTPQLPQNASTPIMWSW